MSSPAFANTSIEALALVAAAAVACSSPGKPPPEATRDLTAQPEPGRVDAAVDRAPEEPIGDRPASVEAMNRGIEAFNAGDLYRAVAALREAVAKDPTFAMAHYNLGLVQLSRKAYDEALEPLATAARLKPDDPLIRARHGEALVELGKHAEAVPELEAAIARTPELFRAHRLLGEAKLALGDHPAAARAWTRACELAPDRGRACLQLADLYRRWRKWAAARAVLEVAARSVKDPFVRADVYLGLGTLHSIDRNRAAAVAAYDQALADNPKLLEARLQRGVEYAALGDWARARSDLSAVIADDSALPFDRQAANETLARVPARLRGRRATIPRSVDLAATRLPAVPRLVLPKDAGKAMSVLRLQVERDERLDTEVTVAGTIVWIYDCVTEKRRPGESRRAARERIDDAPELCSRPSLRLADGPGVRPADGLWVVEVPRPIRADERKYLDEQTIKDWPQVPNIKVGDRVEITGTFARRSPKGFADSDGLLVYGELSHVK